MNIYNRKPKTNRTTTVPQSLLQRITTKVTWAINFRLPSFSVYALRELKLSDRTRSLACSHEQIRIDLIDSIEKDLRYHKRDILAARKADKERDILLRDPLS